MSGGLCRLCGGLKAPAKRQNILLTKIEMRKLHSIAYALIAAIILVGCDSNDEAGVPQVGGEYSGELRITSSDAPNISLNFLMSANVIQSDEDVTITATIVVDGISETLPAITGEISKTGFFTPQAGGTVRVYNVPDPTCGLTLSYASSITFEDDVMIYTAQETFERCGSASATARLTLQE